MDISEVSICNQALSWLGGNRITSLDDESTEAQLCKANYDILRDAVLEAADWSFSIKRFRLVPLAEVPVYGFASAFQIPGEAARILLPIMYDGNGGRVREWEIEDRKILCDYSVLYIKAVTKQTDVSKFSILFSQALAARIAAELSRPLLNKNDNTLWTLYSQKLVDAMANDGLQGPNVESPPGRLISVRSRG